MKYGSTIIPIAVRVITANTTSDYSVIAAPEGPGGDHKHYLHVWPRDAIFVALELRNFKPKIAEKIAEMVLKLTTDNGLFYQRYELNGEPDPKAWCNGDGSRELDQDALKLVAASKFPNLNLDMVKLEQSYTSFLNQIQERKTTTDVWEQKKGYFFYTSAALIWGLRCAEKVIPESEKRHRVALEEIIESIDSFYDEKMRSFVKSPSEKIMDLEVVLGLNILFESDLNFFNTKEKLLRVLSTLEAVERELCIKIGSSKIPIRYKEDFWNGEIVGSNGSGRPWPMGAALISQVYVHVLNAALDMGEYDIASEALKKLKRWMDYVRSMPHIQKFPEQIDYDGSLPDLAPRPLTWCAAEIIKAERLYSEIIKKTIVPADYLLSSIYRPKPTIASVLN